MPVSKQSNVAFTLTKVTIDMLQMTMLATFQRTIDSVPDGAIDILISGSDMATLIATQANAGQSLGSEFTDAVYNYAINKGYIAGAIS